MPKERVSDIVKQTGGRDNGAYIVSEPVLQLLEFRALANQPGGRALPERAANRGYFDGVCQARPNEVMRIQRKYLSLISQTAKGGTEDDTIKIVLERRTGIVLGLALYSRRPRRSGKIRLFQAARRSLLFRPLGTCYLPARTARTVGVQDLPPPA